ncbi:hypothetical protein V6N13_063673 [Hibiscus sabdariffa]
MGREIIRQESSGVGKRSRLWHKDAFDVLREKTGSKTIKCLTLDLNGFQEDKPKGSTTSLHFRKHSRNQFLTSNEVDMETQAFTKMQRLKLLQLDYVKLRGDFKDFPKSLVWLRWHGFNIQSLPMDFCIKRLVVLDMRNNNLKQVWKDKECLPNLKILNLNHSHNLLKTPDFSGLPSLERRSIFLDSNELLRNVIENLDASKKKDSFYKLSKQSCVVSPAYYDFYSSYVTEFLGHWKKIQKVIDYDNHIDHEWVIDAREKELMKLKSLEKAKATELKAIMIVVVKQSKFSPIFQQFRLSTAKLVAVVTFLKKRLLGYAVIEERNLIVGVRIECAFISKLEDMFIVIITFLDTMHELLNGMWILKCTTMSYKADNRRLFLCGTNRNGESFITEWNESGGDAKRTYQGLCKNSSTIVVLSSSLAEDEYDSTFDLLCYKLMLKDCIKLTKFDQSIGELKMLTFLNLKDCKSLRKLPRTIGSLISLEELILSGCSRLYEVPRDLQNMNSFKVLNLDEIAIYQTRLQLPWLLSKRSKKMGFSLCLAL